MLPQSGKVEIDHRSGHDAVSSCNHGRMLSFDRSNITFRLTGSRFEAEGAVDVPVRVFPATDHRLDIKLDM